MDEFEEDFNPRAYETATANGLTNHQSGHNNLLNGQVSSNSNFFSQSNGTTSPPPLCKLISSYFLQSSLVILHYAKGRRLLEAISVFRSPLILFIFVPSLCHFAARRSFISFTFRSTSLQSTVSDGIRTVMGQRPRRHKRPTTTNKSRCTGAG